MSETSFDFAIPELVKRKMKAVFYMPTANTGGYNSWDEEKGTARMELMNEADLKELARYEWKWVHIRIIILI